MAKKRFLVIVVYLLLSTFTAGNGEDLGCKVVPDDQPGVVGEVHEITCFAQPKTIIISWRLGLEASSHNNTVIFHVDLQGSIESTPHSETDGFVVDYYSPRKSRMTISSLALDNAGYVFCCAFDMIAKEKHYCGSRLNVLTQRPSFVSNGRNLAVGLFTDLSCTVTFKGMGVVVLAIQEHGKSQTSPLNSTFLSFENFGLQNVDVSYKNIVAMNLSHNSTNSLSPQMKIQSAFYCNLGFPTFGSSSTTEEGFTYTVSIEVDAPVTFAAIVPESPSKCSERRCRMHERLICISDGRPQPDRFEWTVLTRYGANSFAIMSSEVKNEARTQFSGRSTYECKVTDEMDNYTFVAVAQFYTHVEAFEMILDEYATYVVNGGRPNKVWCPLTKAAIFGAIIWLFMYRCSCATEEVGPW